jgi:hypothetical protein
VWARARYLPLAGALAAVALLLAGCGGDNSPATTVDTTGSQEPSPLTKSALIAQGDGVCAEANAALSALDAGTAKGDPELQATQELQITRSELESLQSLTPPDKDRSDLERFLAALQDQVDALANKKAALAQGEDPAGAETQASDAAASAQAAAQAYGFKDCASAAPAGATDTTTTTTAPTAPTVTTPTTPTTPTTTVPAAPPAPPSGGTGGSPGAGGGTGTDTGGGTGGGGTGGTGGGTGGTGG